MEKKMLPCGFRAKLNTLGLITKLFLLIKAVLKPYILQLRYPFEGFVMLTKEFVVYNGRVYLINLYSSGGWSKLRGKL